MVSFEEVDWVKVGILALLIVLLISLFIVTYSKNCKNDAICLNQYLKNCVRAGGIVDVNGNMQEFKVIGKHGDYCRIFTVMTKPNSKLNAEMQEFFAGKGMVCEIPNKLLADEGITKIKNMNDYCSGPLKEAILQASVDNLYQIVATNLGNQALNQYSAEFGIQ